MVSGFFGGSCGFCRGKHLVVAGLIRDAERGKGTSACPAGPPLSSTADGLGLPTRGRV